MAESIITNYYHSDLWTRFRFRETAESTANQFELEKSRPEEEKCPVPSSSGLADSAKQNATYKALLKEIACEDASIRSISSKVLEKWCKKKDRSFTSPSNINSDNSDALEVIFKSFYLRQSIDSISQETFLNSTAIKCLCNRFLANMKTRSKANRKLLN